MNSAEFERKQREFMEQAVKMAERAGKVSAPVAIKVQEKAEPVEEKEEVISAEEIFDEVTEELSEELDIAKEAVEEQQDERETEEEKEELSFGVFDKDELMKAIENGEVSGESLKQATEILEEMSSKTEAMKRLLEEQEKRYENEEKTDNGADYGLNGYIDRHNNRCRGCSDGNGNNSSR